MYSLRKLNGYVKINILLSVIFLMTACYNSDTPTPPPITNIPKSMRTSIPTIAPLPTQFPTATSSPKIIQHCINLGNKEISLQSVAIGTIIIDGPNVEPISIIDIQSGIEHKLPFQNIKSMLYLGGDVSPNRNMLAYWGGFQNKAGDITDLTLWVTNPRGELLAKIMFNQTNLSNMRWLDNEHLLFYSGQTLKDGTVIVLNPFTREQQFVSNNLPDFYYDDTLRLDWQVEYSPKLDWAVYLRKIEGNRLIPTVYDTVIDKKLWQPPFLGFDFDKPEWSPDGNEVAIITNGQLYIINRSGRAMPILDENSHNQISKVSWSPNGQYVAFWNSYKFMIYDKQTGQVTDYCIENEYPNVPLWSPNSEQFVIDASLGKGGELIDIKKNIGYKLLGIVDTTYPVGWMNSLPK
jgi:WD40 repeat protein